MKVTITREMIDEAISRVDSKLSIGIQKEKVYTPNAESGQYYINNIIGELGEMAFEKAVVYIGHKPGIDAHSFVPFLRSDICDFFTSKTAKTIDVKTVYRDTSDNLLIDERISNWRPVYAYVLVKLFPTKETIHTLETIYEIDQAEILGSLTFNAIKNPRNLRRMYGKSIYFINKNRLTPIRRLIASHFYKKDECEPRYYSEGRLDIDIASVEFGTVIDSGNDIEVDNLAERCRRDNSKDVGHYNFTPMFMSDSNKVVSFSIHNGEFNTGLFFKALLEAEVRARRLKHTLVIPSYIERYIPQSDKERVVEVIDDLKCNVEYIWSHNSIYGQARHEGSQKQDIIKSKMIDDELEF